jgi:PIN domain nuclease of toxin-antitoxin system
MPNYVLDTHACLFALGAPKKLGRRARRAIEAAEAEGDVIFVPAIVASEIVLLNELGRTELSLPKLRAALDASSSWRFLAIDLAQIDGFSSLSGIRDPFDRLIVSAARCTGSKLVSKDATIAELGLVDVVWS